jgi:serine/threonine-protein kinase
MDAGHPVQAEPLLREALARGRARLGDRHPDVLDGMTLLAEALRQLGRLGESESVLRSAIALDGQANTRPDTHAAWHVNDLANVLAVEGRFDEAEAAYAKAIGMYRAVAQGPSIGEAVNLANLARLRFRQGAHAEAESLLRDAIARKQRLLGADYRDNGRGYDQACLAEILVARGQLDAAGPVAEGALAETRATHAGSSPDIVYALTADARLLAARGDWQQAAARSGNAVAMDTALADQGSERAIRARLLFGELLHRLGRDADAQAQLTATLAAVDAMTPAPPSLVAHAAGDLARVDAALGDRDAAARLRARAGSSLAAVTGANGERDEVLRSLAQD